MNQNNNEELMHYGVPGMRWKNRKAMPMSASQARVARAKAAYKAANKQYSKDFNKASGIRNMGSFSPIKKHRQASTARWEKAYDSAKAANKAKDVYKAAKKANKIDKQKNKEIVAQAKAKYKAAKKQYNKDFNKSSTLMGAWGPGNKERHNKTYESALAAERARKAYKAAKKKYR